MPKNEDIFSPTRGEIVGQRCNPMFYVYVCPVQMKKPTGLPVHTETHYAVYTSFTFIHALIICASSEGLPTLEADNEHRMRDEE